MARSRRRARSPGGIAPVCVCAALWLGLARAGPAVLPGAGPGSGLEELRFLAAAPARELALRYCDRHQPSPEQDLQAWQAWESRRLDILVAAGRWPELIRRVRALPPGVSRDFRHHSLDLLARAWAETGQGDRALATLRRILWNPPVPEGAALDALRRRIIETYLDLGLDTDARRAMIRYELDAGPQGPAWHLLKARVLLRSGRPAEAERLLAEAADPVARSLALLAHLEAGVETPASIARQARERAAEAGLSAAVRVRYRVIEARARARAGDWPGRVRALEAALAERADPGERLFEVTGRDLWQALLAWGGRLGNERQLLRGEDGRWIEAAAGAEPAGAAEALLAVPALEGREPETRARAHAALAAAVMARPEGAAVLEALYLEEGGPAAPGDLPSPVRSALADRALARGDFEQASRLLAGLDAPPEGVEPLHWQLRRARIMAYAGDGPGAVAILEALVAAPRPWIRDEIDRLLQVVFDLQAAGLNREVLPVLNAIPVPRGAIQLRRELLFWTADSWKALDEPETAARLYLDSALLPGPETLDPWAQTALYQAADQLTAAGLDGDAGAIYRRLLKHTRDPARRAVLQNRLRRLNIGAGRGEGG